MAAKTPTKRTRKNSTPKQRKAPKTPKPVSLFQGTVTATRVLSRPMKEFKKCQAICWMLISEHEGVYRFANLTFAFSATARNFSTAFRRSSLASADRVTQTSVVETYPLESPTAKL
ncbi:MAG TPA: hypothetical protein VG326_07025, partial [Tepidisphaeraceae bacterium]|nr:hypothetical protein [Tepidisphaeraceae bacterium]